VIIIIIVLGLGIIFHLPIDRQLHSWKLLPEPERFTELYFTEPNSLPIKYLPDQIQNVRFTVHNLEGKDISYKYRIFEISQANGSDQILANGGFTLPQNAYKHESVNISTVDLGPNVKVKVDLMNVKESISYSLERRGA
jgi:hypothetical protein